MLLLNGTNLKKSFSGETLFDGVSFNVYSADKIGFVGVNGAGKSTLFKIIVGQTDCDSGEIVKSKETKIGYLEQYMVSDGNYSAYVAQREIEKLTEQRNYDYTVREIERLEEVVEQQRRWKHKKNKKTHTMDNTRKAIERLENSLVTPEKAPESMRFKFKACAGGGQEVLKTENLGMQFGEKVLFQNVDLFIKKGEKVFLLGPNGCGKTTLLKIIMDIYKPTFGSYKLGESVRVGYYDQLKENLHRDKTVIEEVWHEYHLLTQTEIRSALALFLFKGEDVFKEIKSLSGGELARVELTKLLLKQVNFLIMDEPTNHLDITSREALELALSGYDGTMLMVSHDRYFINKLADKILYLTPNGVIVYEGNYSQFVASRRVASQTPTEVKPEKGLDYKEKKKQESEKRKTLAKFAKLEETIAEMENRVSELSLRYESPEIASDYLQLSEIAAQIDQLNSRLCDLIEEWAQLQPIVEAYNAK